MPDDPLPDGVPRDSTSSSEAGETTPSPKETERDGAPGEGRRSPPRGPSAPGRTPTGGPRSASSPKRPSPILVPREPTSSTKDRIRKWLGGLVGGPEPSPPKRTVGSSTRPGVAPSGPPAAPEAGARAGTNADPSGEVHQPPASGLEVHRATTHMLPGRLQPLNPDVIQQEVRFLRAAEPKDAQVVTLGWDMATPPAHVTLDHPSIQPFHARMTYQGGHWMIETLAPADPVEINGNLLLAEGVPYLLSSGDHIRIGKALFRFLNP